MILCIDPSIMPDFEFLITDGNAASNLTNFYCSLEDLDKLNWACINGTYWTDFFDGKRIKCAEVLIYPILQVNYIKQIITFNDKYKKIINTMIINDKNIKLKIDQSYFF